MNPPIMNMPPHKKGEVRFFYLNINKRHPVENTPLKRAYINELVLFNFKKVGLNLIVRATI